MIIPDIIKAVDKLFASSLLEKELSKGESVLKDVLQNKQPNEENRSKIQQLLIKLTAKKLSIKYFDQGYDSEDYILLRDFLNEGLDFAKKENYSSVVGFCEKLLEIANCISRAMEGALLQIYRVRNDDKQRITSSVEVLKEVLTDFEKRKAIVQSLDETVNVFGDGVCFFDIKSQAINDIQEVISWVSDQVSQLDDAEIKQFLDNHTEFLSNDGIGSCGFSQSFSSTEEVLGKLIVLCSPLSDEIEIFVKNFSQQNGKKIVKFQCNSLLDKNDAFVNRFFTYLSEKDISCLVFGVNSAHDDQRERFLNSAVDFAKRGKTIFVVDDKGDRQVYNDLCKLAEAEKKFTLLDFSYKYLTMPNYNEVISVFEQHGMISGEEYEYVRNNLAFMGYTGFNKAVQLFLQGKSWKDQVERLSISHKEQATDYILRLPSQNQFVDTGWIDLSLKGNVKQSQREFDYDTIRIVNKSNVRKIIEADISLFAKCGAVARYCTLGGEDISLWQTLSKEEKQKRISDATVFVCNLLGNEHQPFVKIVPVDEWTSKGAGGLCCDGGKEIKFREDCCNDYEWLVKAICHESYHALQFTVINCGWQRWHWVELGISKNRPTEWKYNFEHYNGNTSGKTYKVEVVECDARTFENDCAESSSSIWNTIDLD